MSRADDQTTHPDAGGGIDAEGVRSFALGDTEVTVPADIPDQNDVVRAVFGTYDGEALKLLVGDQTAVYLLPWGARRGGVAGYEQMLGDFQVRPIELSPDQVRELLDRHSPRPVALASTPAWVLYDRGVENVKVSWHARVRWGERVRPSPDPGPTIRDAFEKGLSVGISHSYGRYYPPEDVVLAYVYDDGTPLVTTVLQMGQVDDLGDDHLGQCPSCSEPYDPSEPAECDDCGAGVCPWCSESVA
jgi:hypothetical protein